MHWWLWTRLPLPFLLMLMFSFLPLINMSSDRWKEAQGDCQPPLLPPLYEFFLTAFLPLASMNIGVALICFNIQKHRDVTNVVSSMTDWNMMSAFFDCVLPSLSHPHVWDKALLKPLHQHQRHHHYCQEQQQVFVSSNVNVPLTNSTNSWSVSICWSSCSLEVYFCMFSRNRYLPR